MTVSRFTYLIKQTPSPSGIALYAAAYRDVLERLAPTRVVLLPPRPEDSQRLTVILRSVGRTWRASDSLASSVVAVELAGRGVAEFWTAFFLSFRPWSRRLWLTVHDTPAVSGGAFFVTLLDRRGGRRLAGLLSERVGRRAERALLQRAERVYCLSDVGARQLIAQYCLTRSVVALPHVATVSESSVESRRSVFLPGYVDGLENVAPALLAIVDASAEWRVEIGACGEATTDAVGALANELGIRDRVDLLGYLDEQGLGDAFERAAVVVRWKQSGWAREGQPGCGAVSGPLIYAMAHGCAIITNDTRGVVGCLTESGSVQIDSGPGGADQYRAALSMLLNDAGQREEMATRGRTHVARRHEVAAVARQLLEAS